MNSYKHILWMTNTAFVALLMACASSPKKSDADLRDEASKPEFDRGMRLLEAEDFGAAADTFDRLLVAKPASEVDLVTLFNSGAAHEGLGDCNKANERYREVVRSSAGRFPRIEAQAMFRSSLMYECLGQDAKTIAALLDTKKRSRDLTLEVDRAELPARLASAYSRLGNRAKALEYFRQADSGLKAILASGHSSRKQREVVARTLFYMGRLSPAQRSVDGDPQVFLESLSIQQAYLLQSLEINVSPWSRRALDDLTTAYDNILRFSIKERDKRSAFYVRALQVIAELRKIRMPDAGPQEDAVYAQVDKTERQLRIQMTDIAETTRLTPESERREGLRRQGRLVDPKVIPSVRKPKK